MPTVYTQEFKQRALRLMEDHLQVTQCSQWSAAQAVGTKLGISPHTMRGWLKQARRDVGFPASCGHVNHITQPA